MHLPETIPTISHCHIRHWEVNNGKGATTCEAPWRAAVVPACRHTYPHRYIHTHTLTCTDTLMTTSTSAALQLPSSTSLFGRGCRATGCVNTAPDMSKERATRRSGTCLHSSVDSAHKTCTYHAGDKSTRLHVHMERLNPLRNISIFLNYHT